jgi:hypothetical protein
MKQHLPVLMIAVVVGLVVAGIQGCQLADIIKVKTPVPIQQSDGLPAKLPLSQARGEYLSWRAETQRSDAEWRESIDGGEEFVGLLEGVGMTALQEFSPLAGPAALPALLLGGYFFGNSNKRKNKEASYNAGLEKGKSLAREIVEGVRA